MSGTKGNIQGPIFPFRWDVKKRNELGGLIGEPDDNRDKWLNWEEVTANAYHWHPAYTYAVFLNALGRYAARVIAFCDDSDLCFVGRSPESIFDHLSGLLFDTSWAQRLTLLHFSMHRESLQDILNEYPVALEEMHSYLTWMHLDPPALATRERPLAFVDIVASGRTLGNLIGIIHNWSKQMGFDWSAVQRKIRVVGLTERTKTSPNTWRW